MIRILISKQIWHSFKALEESYMGKNENKIQRDLAMFMYYTDKFKEVRNNYYNSICETKNATKKELLINCLKFVGEPDKSDSIYAYDWENLFRTLNKCGIITDKEIIKFLKRIEKIIGLDK